MNIKLISFDLDGTLIYDDKISEKTIEAFRILKSKGIKMIANTGRSIQSLKPIFEKLNLYGDEDFSIITTGSAIYENKKNKLIYHSFLTLKDYFNIKKNINDKYNIGVYTPNEIYYVNEIFDEIIEDNQTLKMPIFKFDEEKEIEISRINIMANKEMLDNFLKNENLDFLNEYYYVRNIDISLEILNKNASKGNGLLKLIEKLNISKDEILAIGDGNNDVSMFEIAKYSVAMGNASESVKSKAKYVTESVQEDGFYNICKKLSLLD